MGSLAAMGVGAWRLLRSHSPMESAVFWTVLTLSYLALSFLAGARGIGYAERVDLDTHSITFELNPVLWLPDLFLHAYPPTNPVPFLMWWVIFAALITEGIMVPMRLLRRGPRRSRTGVTAAQKSRPA